MGIPLVSTFTFTEKISSIVKLSLPGERKREVPWAWQNKTIEKNNTMIIIEIIMLFIACEEKCS